MCLNPFSPILSHRPIIERWVAYIALAAAAVPRQNFTPNLRGCCHLAVALNPHITKLCHKPWAATHYHDNCFHYNPISWPRHLMPITWRLMNQLSFGGGGGGDDPRPTTIENLNLIGKYFHMIVGACDKCYPVFHGILNIP